MKLVFYCPYCGNDITYVDFDQKYSFLRIAEYVVEQDCFKCDCGALFQFGLFDVKHTSHEPIKAE